MLWDFPGPGLSGCVGKENGKKEKPAANAESKPAEARGKAEPKKKGKGKKDKKVEFNLIH